MATAMIYVGMNAISTCGQIDPHFEYQLSDGIEGGGTAFPKLGVVAFPVKGSVVYWHSLRNDGQTDIRSLHGGCPTVLGVKWGERDQCLYQNDLMPTRESVFQWPTNGYARELKFGNGRAGRNDLLQGTMKCTYVFNLQFKTNPSRKEDIISQEQTQHST